MVRSAGILGEKKRRKGGSNEKRKEGREGREGRKEGRKDQTKKEGMKEGSNEKRKEGRKEGSYICIQTEIEEGRGGRGRQREGEERSS